MAPPAAWRRAIRCGALGDRTKRHIDKTVTR